jgi:hypothetical protein
VHAQDWSVYPVCRISDFFFKKNTKHLTMRLNNIIDDFEEAPHDHDGEPFEDSDVVAHFYSLLEAEVAAARLRAEGIPCFLANTHVQNMFNTGNFAAVRLHVRKEEVEMARELLQETLPDPEQETEKGVGAKSWLILAAILLGLFVLQYLLRWWVSENVKL